MQIGSSSLSAQLQALDSQAQTTFQSGQDFSFVLDEVMNSQPSDASAPSASSSSEPSTAPTTTGGVLSGSVTGTSLYAVGTVGADGQVSPFSSQQIAQEQAALSNVQRTSYSNALENFLTLAQAASPAGGPTQAASMTEQQQFVGDNGLIATSSSMQFSYRPLAVGN